MCVRCCCCCLGEEWVRGGFLVFCQCAPRLACVSPREEIELAGGLYVLSSQPVVLIQEEGGAAANIRSGSGRDGGGRWSVAHPTKRLQDPNIVAGLGGDRAANNGGKKVSFRPSPDNLT